MTNTITPLVTYRDLFQAAGNVALWTSYAIIRSEKKEKDPSSLKTILTIGVIGISAISSLSRLKILLKSSSPAHRSELTVPIAPISIHCIGQTIQIKPRVILQANGDLSLSCNGMDLTQVATIGMQGYDLYKTAKIAIPQIIACAKQNDRNALACAAVHVLNLGSDAAALGITLSKE